MGLWFQGRVILAHLCDEPKGLKTNMCMVKKKQKLLIQRFLTFFRRSTHLPSLSQSLLYLPFALANALTARLNDGYVFFRVFLPIIFIWVIVFCLSFICRVPLVDEFWVLLGYCIFTMSLYMHFATSVIHEITTALGIYCFRLE